MISPPASFWILSTVIAIGLWTGLDYWIYRRPTSDAVKMSATVIAQRESLPQRIESPLQIEFGTGDIYERTECINETGIVRRLIYVSMFNESVDDISDCNIRLIAASPRPKTGDNLTNFPVPFGPNFDLRGNQRKFIQTVRFAENPGGNPSALERDNIIISAASGGLSPGFTTLPIPSEDNPATLTLEAFHRISDPKRLICAFGLIKGAFTRKLSKK